MNCFQIIKTILDEAYNDIEGNEIEKDQMISEALEYLRNQYSSLMNGAIIDYSNPITRFAYIYVYVTSHANLVYSIIEKTTELNSIFDQQKTTVSCIGGGPGSDFLGILKYLMISGKKNPVKFQLCDKEKTWAESWHDVDDKVDPGFRISTSYLPFDVTKPEDWSLHAKYLQADIFTMIYFMSEVASLREVVDPYFTNLFQKSKPGSTFLFVDNNSKSFYEWFDELANENGVSIIKSQETFMVAPSDEKRADLGVYYEKFSSPKLKANVAYRVAIKVDS
jgi:hypothetical protein